MFGLLSQNTMKMEPCSSVTLKQFFLVTSTTFTFCMDCISSCCSIWASFNIVLLCVLFPVGGRLQFVSGKLNAYFIQSNVSAELDMSQFRWASLLEVREDVKHFKSCEWKWFLFNHFSFWLIGSSDAQLRSSFFTGMLNKYRIIFDYLSSMYFILLIRQLWYVLLWQ